MDFWEIYDQYYRPVKVFLTKMSGSEWVAEDLAQETFIKVQAGMDDLRDKDRLKSWIFAIARNKCLDFFRSKAHNAENQEFNETVGIHIKPMDQFKMEQREMSQCVQDKMQLLSESSREVLILYDTMELSQKEIADILGISEGNVKTRLHRARKAMKEILQRECLFEQDERNVMVCIPRPEDGNGDEPG